MAKKIYQKNRDGSKFYDKSGFNRYKKEGSKDKATYGSNYRIGIGTKKFSK